MLNYHKHEANAQLAPNKNNKTSLTEITIPVGWLIPTDPNKWSQVYQTFHDFWEPTSSRHGKFESGLVDGKTHAEPGWLSISFPWVFGWFLS